MSLAISNRLLNIVRMTGRSSNKLQFCRGILLNSLLRNEQTAEKSEEETEQQKVLVEKDQEIESLKKESSEFKDKYMRALAENENIMKRNTKFLADAKLYAVQSFSKDLLEISDILEKATESVSKDDLKANKELANLYEGLTMTHTQLHKVFSKHGLEKEDPLGEKFDPNFHEAVFQIPDPGKEKGTVSIVQKVGYRLHGRTLRPAIVAVVQ